MDRFNRPHSGEKKKARTERLTLPRGQKEGGGAHSAQATGPVPHPRVHRPRPMLGDLAAPAGVGEITVPRSGTAGCACFLFWWRRALVVHWRRGVTRRDGAGALAREEAMHPLPPHPFPPPNSPAAVSVSPAATRTARRGSGDASAARRGARRAGAAARIGAARAAARQGAAAVGAKATAAAIVCGCPVLQKRGR
jgi:hypothetical protein